jgi:nitrogen regulatory protein PII
MLMLTHKLVITIVKKGMASKIVKASKKAGAEGGTIIFGQGTGIHEKDRILGIDIIPEKEIILSLVQTQHIENVLERMMQAGRLNKPGTGVAFVICTKSVGGIVHLLSEPQQELVKEEGCKMVEASPFQYDLIVSIVNAGDSDKVVNASKLAGAEGGTIIHGRGTGIHEHAKLFSILIEPEKEIILTLIERSKTEAVLSKIMEDAELNKPGHGIAFVLPVDKTVGINHALNKMVNDVISQNKND